MSNAPNDFLYTDSVEPHRARTKEILSKYPEVRELVGRNPFTFAIIILVVGLQLTIAYFLRRQPLWEALLAAFLVGAFANHTLYVLIHEAAHNLIFKKRAWNMIAGIIADIPNLVPGSVSFRTYHLKHHSHQGDYFLDADLPYVGEAKFFGRSCFGKMLWELLFPFIQAIRPLRLRGIEFMNFWTMVNWIVIFSIDALIVIYFGPVALLYLLFSLFFSIGLHPLGARWIQEHFLVAPPQETYSYYGPLNKIALNVGYHNEHHDFQSVPWNKLPAIKQTAPEFYENLYYHTSWSKLWLKFLFVPKLTLFSRMVRNTRPN